MTQLLGSTQAQPGLWEVGRPLSSFSHSSKFTFRVVAGDHNLSQNDGTEQYVQVQKIVVHPSWNSNNVAAG